MEVNSHLVELLRERKLKATSTRLEVLSLIFDYNKAIPFSEIQNTLHNFDRVTLYRTLLTLIENGIIHKALQDEKETFFAVCSNSCSANCHNHKHIHFKCSSCHTVTCVQARSLISFSIPGHSIENFKIEATGVCESCN
ncbi:MAG: Fur family ferric uptake transcriptional regulator [Bacteroidia bacterium]|jgi:Fur family ferric uptake transcriptional regulator